MSNFSGIINSPTPTLVDFFAEWCGPCKLMPPHLKQVKEQLGESITILKIDVDKNPAAAAAYGIQGVPTLILFENGIIKWRQSGVVSAPALLKIIKEKTAL